MPKFNQVAIAIAGVVRCLNLISYQLLQKLLAAVLFRDAFFKTFLTQEAICKMTLGSYFSIKKTGNIKLDVKKRATPKCLKNAPQII